MPKRIVLTSSLNGMDRQKLADMSSYSHDYVRYAMWELVAHELTDRGVQGAVAELGVYKGNSAAFLNELFPERKLYLFDTFDGFDERDVEVEQKNAYSNAGKEFSDTSVQAVLARMSHPEQCVVREGFFPETAEGLEERFALVSLDADLYQPIYDGLCYFYPRMAAGGAIFVHDYNHQRYTGVKAAVRRFSEESGVGFLPIPDTAGSVAIQKAA